MSYSILETIGNTPLVELKNIFNSKTVKIVAKLEGNNPAGSVKDRPAKNMIIKALERGEITGETKLIEPTSGNTGIALAMVARVCGLNIELVMPENSTQERVLTMKAYGAKVTLTPASGGMEASIDYAHEKVKSEGYFMLDQFSNPDNYLAHYYSTAPEIWYDTEGSITHFISSMGTTGTIIGSSKFLKEKNKEIQIIGCRPTEGSKIPGIRRWQEPYLPKILDTTCIDSYIDVSEENAKKMTLRLAREEGILAGMSSGGCVYAAVEVAQKLNSGLVVCIICDRGDRYLSSGLFG